MRTGSKLATIALVLMVATHAAPAAEINQGPSQPSQTQAVMATIEGLMVEIAALADEVAILTEEVEMAEAEVATLAADLEMLRQRGADPRLLFFLTCRLNQSMQTLAQLQDQLEAAVAELASLQDELEAQMAALEAAQAREAALLRTLSR